MMQTRSVMPAKNVWMMTGTDRFEEKGSRLKAERSRP